MHEAGRFTSSWSLSLSALPNNSPPTVVFVFPKRRAKNMVVMDRARPFVCLCESLRGWIAMKVYGSVNNWLWFIFALFSRQSHPIMKAKFEESRWSWYSAAEEKWNKNISTSVYRDFHSVFFFSSVRLVGGVFTAVTSLLRATEESRPFSPNISFCIELKKNCFDFHCRCETYWHCHKPLILQYEIKINRQNRHGIVSHEPIHHVPQPLINACAGQMKVRLHVCRFPWSWSQFCRNRVGFTWLLLSECAIVAVENFIAIDLFRYALVFATIHNNNKFRWQLSRFAVPR